MKTKIFTIGYATKDADSFIRCLKKNNVTCLIDVRSTPFSKTFPLYDKANLKDALNKEGILYAHFGEEFGARRNEEEAYAPSYSLKGELKDQVSFHKVYELPLFQKGVERTLNAIKQGYNVCFMCSEKHPVDCHRFWMVAYYFKTHLEGFDIINIITEDENESFDQVIAQVELDKEEKKFYKNHEELNSFALFDMPISPWVKWWDEFFKSNNQLTEKVHTFSNIRIGYARGEEEHD